MSRFRPQMTIEKNNPDYDYWKKFPEIVEEDNYTVFKYRSHIVFSFKTHVELKRNMKKIMKKYNVSYCSVNRSRRGEWGEWFEKWELVGRKLYKLKEGWM